MSDNYVKEHVLLLSNEPILLPDGNFIALGKLGMRGDKYMVFMDLNTGSIYVQEVWAAEALGEHLVGLNYIDDDKIWNTLVWAADKLGLTSKEHIIACLKCLDIKPKNKVLKDIYKGKAPK